MRDLTRSDATSHHPEKRVPIPESSNTTHSACRGVEDGERMLHPLARFTLALLLLAVVVPAVHAQPRYEILLKGGHVIDPRNNVDAVMAVAVAAGKIAAVRPCINPADSPLRPITYPPRRSIVVRRIGTCVDVRRPSGATRS